MSIVELPGALREAPGAQLGAAVLAASAAAAAASRLALVPLPPPSARKPYDTFAVFYQQRYLAEHREAGTRILHCLGTVLMVALLARTPVLAVALLTGIAAGLAVAPFLRFLDRGGLVEFALLIVIFLSTGSALCGSLLTTVSVPFVAYGCAWAGHFFVEHNTPATFVYPTWSLVSDFVMMVELATGALTLWKKA